MEGSRTWRCVRPCRSRSCGGSRPTTMRCSGRATCSTCRRTTRRWRCNRRLHDLFDRFRAPDAQELRWIPRFPPRRTGTRRTLCGSDRKTTREPAPSMRGCSVPGRDDRARRLDKSWASASSACTCPSPTGRLLRTSGARAGIPGFEASIKKRGVALDRRTRFLYDNQRFYRTAWPPTLQGIVRSCDWRPRAPAATASGALSAPRCAASTLVSRWLSRTRS